MTSQLDNTDPEARRLLAQEMLLMDAQELVVELMDKAGMNRGQLARALDKSNGFVSQVLSGERNMTLRTLADLACATGHRVELRAVSIETPKRYALHGTAVLRDNGVEEQLFRNAYMPICAAPNAPVQIQRTQEPMTTHHDRRRRTLEQTTSSWCAAP